MKLQQLRKLIKEELETALAEAPIEETTHKLEKDELGKFYVVTKPSQPKENNIHETNIMEFAKKIKSGELDEARIVGVYEKSGAAKTKSKELLDEIDIEMNELKTHMDDFRSKKSELKYKQVAVKTIIDKYKK
jgi:hypothetical protein